MLSSVSGVRASNNNYLAKQNTKFTSFYVPYASMWGDLASNSSVGIIGLHKIKKTPNRLGLWLKNSEKAAASNKYRVQSDVPIILTEEHFTEFNKLSGHESQKEFLNSFLKRIGLNVDEQSEIIMAHVRRTAPEDFQYYHEPSEHVENYKI